MTVSSEALFGRDTVVAVSTPPGTGGIAVVRLSGPDALSIAASRWRGRDLRKADGHTALYGHIDDSNGEPLDDCLALVMRGPRSFTGEDTVEFSIHGSPWLQRAVTQSLAEAGARPAERGEFSRRAFLNGRIDLAQAEGIADVLAASSRAALRLAQRQTSGEFSRRLDSLRDKLVEFAALIELELDFSEEDVEFADRSRLIALLDEVIGETGRLAATYRAGRVFKEGIPVVIAGVPNAGKSTLLNLLLGEEKAIVTDIPGTTRDVIEDTREIGGLLFRFSDTAGLRDAEDAVERIGVDRARALLEKASIIVWVIDVTRSLADQLADYRRLAADPSLSDTRHILLLNKADIHPSSDACTYPSDAGISSPCRDMALPCVGADDEKDLSSFMVDEKPLNEIIDPDTTLIIKGSAKSGNVLPLLQERLTEITTATYNPDSELIVTNARHARSLTDATEALRRARSILTDGLPSDLATLDIRQAVSHLGEVTGAITTDDLLSFVFSRFCIGK